MANLFPAAWPTAFSGTITDFNKCKSDRSGALRLEPTQVAVATSSTIGTILGLVPFRKGARLDLGSNIQTDFVGTASAVSLGYLYYSTAQTSVSNFWTSSSTIAGNAGGGVLPIAISTANALWAAVDDGWIVAQIGGATTTATTANIYGQIKMTYDSAIS